MSNYGVTENGFMLKRLDVIKSDICTRLKDSWGIDPSINPQSALNVLITSFSDEIAALWELAQDTYYSQYPSSASGINLDNAMQLGGVTRLCRTKTKYNIKCTGSDGTLIPYGAMLKSTTQPVKSFICSKNQTISRENFLSITFGIISDIGATYSVEINGTLFSTIGVSSDPVVTLQALYDEIEYATIDKVLDLNNLCITLTSKSKHSSHTMVTSDNIVVTSVSANITFESEDYGQVLLPFNTITEITTLVAGLQSVTNETDPILGRDEETDIEARHSYLKRIFLHSSNMIESIVAEITENVEDITALIAYENDTNVEDEYGRPPHSIEIVAEGGSASTIAKCIYNKKATGIQTYGNEEVSILDDYGNTHKIRFNRPTSLNTWLKVTLTRDGNAIQPNYVSIVKDSIISSINTSVGENIYLQTLLVDIYKNITGVKYIEIRAAISDTEPVDYNLDNIDVGPREKVSISTDRIEVVLSGS